MGVVVAAAACGTDRSDEGALPVAGGEAGQQDPAGARTPVAPVSTTGVGGGGAVPIPAAEGITSVTSSNVSFGDAERVFRSGDYASAVEMFGAYATRMPENPWGHYMLGISAWRAGNHGSAEAALRRTIEVDPKHVKGYTNLARVLLEQRKASDALDFALKVVERVTVMHNGRVLRHGTPDEIENDAQVQAIYMGGKH